MRIGPRGGFQSPACGGCNLYRKGVGAAGPFLALLELLDFGSGVALALELDPIDPALDSLFFNVSFFALDARSRARGASSCGFEALKSGFRGEDTVGW